VEVASRRTENDDSFTRTTDCRLCRAIRHERWAHRCSKDFPITRWSLGDLGGPLTKVLERDVDAAADRLLPPLALRTDVDQEHGSPVEPLPEHGTRDAGGMSDEDDETVRHLDPAVKIADHAIEPDPPQSHGGFPLMSNRDENDRARQGEQGPRPAGEASTEADVGAAP
jgi:hypothetical protein